MDIYLAIDGERRGPFTRFQVHELLEEGKVDRKTLGWIQDEDSWKPIEEIPALLSLIQALEQEKLDEELAKDPGPLPSPQKDRIPQERLTSHAFARFGARMLDVFLFQTLVLLIVNLEPPSDVPGFLETLREGETREQQIYRYQLLLLQTGSMLGWHVIESFVIAITGTTFGKFLFNLRVQNSLGQRPGPGLSFARSILVWILGMGAGLMIFQWIANFLAFRRLQLTGIATWDGMLHTEVIQGPISQGRMIFILICSALIFGANYSLMAF